MRSRIVCLQADDDAVLAQSCYIPGIFDRAAARRDDGVPAPCNALDHLVLSRAEVRLPLLREHVGDGHARLALDLLVEVEEGGTELLCEHAARARLARPHEADQHDVLHRHHHSFPMRAWRSTIASEPNLSQMACAMTKAVMASPTTEAAETAHVSLRSLQASTSSWLSISTE